MILEVACGVVLAALFIRCWPWLLGRALPVAVGSLIGGAWGVLAGLYSWRWHLAALLGLALIAGSWLWVREEQKRAAWLATLSREEAFEERIGRPLPPTPSLAPTRLDYVSSRVASGHAVAQQMPVPASEAPPEKGSMPWAQARLGVGSRREPLRVDTAGPELCLTTPMYEAGIARAYPRFKRAVIAHANQTVGKVLPDIGECIRLGTQTGFLR